VYHWLLDTACAGFIAVGLPREEGIDIYRAAATPATVPFFVHPQNRMRALALTQSMRVADTIPVEEA
jgi:hypothetical protein